jgi:Holliday junction resolvase RusA-like endonuclease
MSEPDIAFLVSIIPTAKGRPRFSRKTGRVYTPAETEAAERSFRSLAVAHRPAEPLEGPLFVQLVFGVPIPKKSRWWHEAALARCVWPTPRPDLDNYEKLVLDALNGIFWLDDSQIVKVEKMKAYAPSPFISVRISKIAQPETATEWKTWQQKMEEGL